MKIESVQIEELKRFKKLCIHGLPDSARLVVLLGPNGCGKSSLFDLLHTKLKIGHFFGFGGRDPFYFNRQLDFDKNRNDLSSDIARKVNVAFHGSHPDTEQKLRKSIYLRTAYRNEASFQQTNLTRPPKVLEEQPARKTIDDDKTVSVNFNRLFWRFLHKAVVPERNTSHIMEETIGEIRIRLQNVFEDLSLDSLVSPDEIGTFVFTKGGTENFLYDNLSGGEKAVFDLFLDIVVKRQEYDDSIYCIDEPETHLSTRLQARVLRELFALVPENSQLWIASHAIGMVRESAELWSKDPSKVVFLDFGFRPDGTPRNFNEPETVCPVNPNRAFWNRHYDIALDDLSELVAPEQIVLCEGEAQAGSEPFDESCYNRLFATEFPHTLFISVGSCNDVEKRVAGLVPLINRIVRGVKIIRLRDRDEMTPVEVAQATVNGIRVLSKRNLESVLLSDEILRKLCEKHDSPEKSEVLIDARDDKVKGNIVSEADDFKPAAQAVHQTAKRELPITRPGGTKEAFMRDILAPLVDPETDTYAQLKQDIFGESRAHL